MNWEMRNTFKEWMFKYYVLGNLSLDSIARGPTGNADFRMPSIDTTRANDSYNFPSVCINFSGTSSVDICKNYLVSGLPVFKSSDLVGIDQTTTAFLNTMVAEKNKDCVDRTTLNFMAANLWAYNVQDSASSLLTGAPEIASHRQGAFPQAFELALRIRNLEKFVNKAPRTQGVCADPGSAAGNCADGVMDIMSSQGREISNERVIKAFYAGYRNLGADHDMDMKRSFTLTELPPTPVFYDEEFSLSNLLIPNGTQNRTKHYLDLKLMTMNYATFFTSFSPDKGSVSTTSFGAVDADGQCSATKVALPVPGYPLGFVKNPRVLTYYAVRGEARFTGLFNPFDVVEDGIKITAYSAAKPFGGRIGPMLMSVFQNESKLFARQSGGKNRSSPYLTGIDLTKVNDLSGNPVASAGNYVPGAPLPLNGNPADPFWLTRTDQAVGGWTSTSGLVFSLPNIAYDYPSNSPTDSASYYAANKIDVVVPSTGGASPQTGLYNGNILNKLRKNLPNIGGVVSPGDIDQAVRSARQPTLLDAYNYMVPTPNSINQTLGVDSFGQITSPPDSEGHYKARFFAPLITDIPDALYSDISTIVSTYDNYILAQDMAIKKYVVAMNHAAKAMSQLTSSDDGTAVALDAASAFSDIDFAGAPETEKPSCASLAGKFAYFYQGQNLHVKSGAVCPTPMKDIIKSYWSNNADSIGNFYNTEIKYDPSIEQKLFSAYRPGPLNDAAPNGIWKRSIGSSVVEKMWRNFYSTKFVQLKSVAKGGSYDASGGSNFAIMSEGNNQDNSIGDISISGGAGRAQFQNPLNVSSLGIDLNNIDY